MIELQLSVIISIIHRSLDSVRRTEHIVRVHMAYVQRSIRKTDTQNPFVSIANRQYLDRQTHRVVVSVPRPMTRDAQLLAPQCA